MQKIINQSMTLHKSLILATTQDMRMHFLLVTRIKDRVMIGDIQLQDLVVSKSTRPGIG
jgi:hypothetical protein